MQNTIRQLTFPTSIAFLFGLSLFANAQLNDWTIQTIAGTGKAGFIGDGGPALEAQLDNPFGVVRGPTTASGFANTLGNAFVAFVKMAKSRRWLVTAPKVTQVTGGQL